MLRKVQKLVSFLKEESKFTRGIYRGLVLLHSCTTPGPFSVLWKRRSPENWHRYYYLDSLDSGALQRLANGRQRLKEGGWEERDACSCSAPPPLPPVLAVAQSLPDYGSCQAAPLPRPELSTDPRNTVPSLRSSVPGNSFSLLLVPGCFSIPSWSP